MERTSLESSLAKPRGAHTSLTDADLHSLNTKAHHFILWILVGNGQELPRFNYSPMQAPRLLWCPTSKKLLLTMNSHPDLHGLPSQEQGLVYWLSKFTASVAWLAPLWKQWKVLDTREGPLHEHHVDQVMRWRPGKGITHTQT